MAEIIKITNRNDLTLILEKTNSKQIQLLELSEGASTVLRLSHTTMEEVNGDYYYIDGGNYTLNFSAAVDGTLYLYLFENTSDATKGDYEFSATVPVWDELKAGYYNGTNKAIYRIVKSGLNTSDKLRIENGFDILVSNDIAVDDYIQTTYGIRESGNILGTFTSGDIYTLAKELFSLDETHYRSVTGYIKDIDTNDTFSITYVDMVLTDSIRFWGLQNLEDGTTTTANYVQVHNNSTLASYIIALAW